jgi:hypothetical protein
MLNILTSDEFIDGLGHDAFLEALQAGAQPARPINGRCR